MKKRVFQSCTILVLGLAAIQTVASAQETPGIEGVWFADVTAVYPIKRLCKENTSCIVTPALIIEVSL